MHKKGNNVSVDGSKDFPGIDVDGLALDFYVNVNQILWESGGYQKALKTGVLREIEYIEL